MPSLGESSDGHLVVSSSPVTDSADLNKGLPVSVGSSCAALTRASCGFLLFPYVLASHRGLISAVRYTSRFPGSFTLACYPTFSLIPLSLLWIDPCWMRSVSPGLFTGKLTPLQTHLQACHGPTKPEPVRRSLSVIKTE